MPSTAVCTEEAARKAFSPPVPSDQPNFSPFPSPHGFLENRHRRSVEGLGFATAFIIFIFIQVGNHTFPTPVGVLIFTLGWTVLGFWLLELLTIGKSLWGRVIFWAVAIPVTSAILILVGLQGLSPAMLLVGLSACASAAYIEYRWPGLVKDVLILSSVPILLYTIIQWAGLDWNLWHYMYTGRIHAGIGTANHLASFTVLVCMAALTPSLRLEKWVRSVICLGAIFAAVATESRSGLLVLVSAASLFAGIRLFTGTISPIRRLAISIGIVFAVGSIALLIGGKINERFTPEHMLLDGSVVTRMYLWRSFPDHLHGLEWLVGSTKTAASGPVSVDNFVLDLLMDRGVLGFMPALGLAWLLCILSGQQPNRFSSPNGDSGYAWVLVSFFLSSLPHALTPLHEVLFWILVGAAVASWKPSPAATTDRISSRILLSTLGFGIALALIAKWSQQMVPFRPPDSPGFFPYPDPSPLPSWLGWSLDAVRSSLFAGVAAVSLGALGKAIVSLFGAAKQG